MATLVDKTLKTTRLEAGHFPFEFALVDLAAVAAKVVERMPQDGAASAEAGAARGAAPRLGRPRPHVRGDREPDLERDQVLARGRGGRGGAGPRGRPRDGSRPRPRHRHRRGRPGPPLPPVLARARPPRGVDRGVRASASTSATAWCARTAAACGRERARPWVGLLLHPAALRRRGREHAGAGRDRRRADAPRGAAHRREAGLHHPRRGRRGRGGGGRDAPRAGRGGARPGAARSSRRRRWPSGCATTHDRGRAPVRAGGADELGDQSALFTACVAARRPGPAGGGARRGRARPRS